MSPPHLVDREMYHEPTGNWYDRTTWRRRRYSLAPRLAYECDGRLRPVFPGENCSSSANQKNVFDAAARQTSSSTGDTGAAATILMTRQAVVPMPQSDLFKPSEKLVGGQPLCPNCGRAMRLYSSKRTGTPGRDLVIFSCSECAQQQSALVEYEEIASAC